MNDVETNALGGTYEKPKMWKELTSEEKIERMRGEIKRLQNMLSMQGGRMNSIEENFRKHNHLDGKVVKDMTNEYGAIGGSVSGIKSLVGKDAEDKGECFF